jgi:hypothetical protein
MAYESITRRTLRKNISRDLRDLLVDGTATAGASNTLTDTVNVNFSTTDALKGAWIYIHTGTSSGDERLITASTTAGVITVSDNWSSTPDTTSKYEIHRKRRVDWYNELINRGLRADRVFHMRPQRDVSLLTRNLLSNALFSDWANGAAAAPDDWTLSGSGAAVAQDSNLNVRGPYAARVTNGASNAAALTQTIYNVMDGNTYTFTAVVHASVASRVTIKLNDGVSTAVSSDNHGAAGLEQLSAVLEVDATTSRPQLAASLEISSGGAMAVGIDSAFIEAQERIYDYALPSNFHTVDEVSIASSTGGVGNPDTINRFYPEPDPDWEVIAGFDNPDPLLRLNRGNISSDREILVKGMRYVAVPTVDTDTINVNTELVELYCEYHGKQQLGMEGWDAARADYLDLRHSTRVVYPASSVYVEPN